MFNYTTFFDWKWKFDFWAKEDELFNFVSKNVVFPLQTLK